MSEIAIHDGVSVELAEKRACNIKDVSYRLKFSIPKDIKEHVEGVATIQFEYIGEKSAVILDFAAANGALKSLKVNGKTISAVINQEHIVIAQKYLRPSNVVEAKFISGDKALNRKPEFMYTLFVPDKARSVFPCFDQPNIKAKYDLTLTIPSEWKAVSNAPIHEERSLGESKRITFEQTDLISTYQFAFTAGLYQMEERIIDGRTYRMYHRETDSTRVANNVDSIFDIVSSSVRWMEHYTGIKMPYKKNDFIIIPSFQFSGMEHVGAIYYNDSKLWLGRSATLQDRMARVELIGHETAHLWFGDWVTMSWFDDVWLKEVFAGFFADKIVEDHFPHVNNNLQFLIAHAPKAYAEDRTLGNHAIRQPLENLNQAGSLYGNIVYHKSPIAIRSLENLMGKEAFKEALREYLTKYSNGNASWLDLVQVLNRHTKLNVTAWSKAWIEREGMPVYEGRYELASDVVSQFYLKQISEVNNGIIYPQRITYLAMATAQVADSVVVSALNTEMSGFKGISNLNAFIPNSNGMGYGTFLIDGRSVEWLSKGYFNIQDPVTRGSLLINLYENFLLGNVTKEQMLNFLLFVIDKGNNRLNQGLAFDYLNQLCITFITDDSQVARVEELLWRIVDNADSPDFRTLALRCLYRITKTQDSAQRLYALWREEMQKKNRWISNLDLQNISLELGIRFPALAAQIIYQMEREIANRDALERYKFIARAVSPLQSERDRLFYSFMDVENRKNEPWVVEALKYLNHPLREQESEKYISDGLALLPEIQTTGDIFFPKNWLTSLFYGHKSANAYKVVLSYRNQMGNKIPHTLMLKLLQASDNLRRANQL